MPPLMEFLNILDFLTSYFFSLLIISEILSSFKMLGLGLNRPDRFEMNSEVSIGFFLFTV